MFHKHTLNFSISGHVFSMGLNVILSLVFSIADALMELAADVAFHGF